MRGDYRPELDGLRGIAAASVLFFHSGMPGFAGGNSGVDVFFVLSGYLITSIIREELREGTFSVTRFWWNRAVRLVPALVLMVTAVVLLSPLLSPEDNIGAKAISALTYTMNLSLWMEFSGSSLNHTWSLAVEEHFYLLWPIVMLGLVSVKRPALILLGVWLLITLARLHLAETRPWPEVMFPTHLRASGLVLGAALAYVRLPAWSWIPGAVVLLPSLSVVPPSGWSLPITELATAAVIGGLQRRPCPLGSLLAWEPLRQLGLISYGVYLWHLPIIGAMPPVHIAIGIPLVFVWSVAIALLSYQFVEQPLRQRYRKSSKAASLAAA